jgi:hypothetical protein
MDKKQRGRTVKVKREGDAKNYNGGGLDGEVPDAGGACLARGGAVAAVQARAAVACRGARVPHLQPRTVRINQPFAGTRPAAN